MGPRNLSPRSRVTLAPWLPRNDIITPNRVSPPGQVGNHIWLFGFLWSQNLILSSYKQIFWFVNIDTHKQRLAWACLALKTYSLGLWIYSSYHLELSFLIPFTQISLAKVFFCAPPQVCHPNNKVGFLLSPLNPLFPFNNTHLTFVKVFFSGFSTTL